MTKDRGPTHRGRTLLAAAALVAGGLFASVTGSAQAAPLSPAPAEAVAADSGIVSVRHGWGHHHHHGWGHRGWHRHRHHHHWGHRHHRHHHHHRGWRHRW